MIFLKVIGIAYLVLLSKISVAQEPEIFEVKPPIITAYKSDTTFNNFNKLRFDVSKAQIIMLKKNGALLVRLKTNLITIKALKVAGNIDMATQVERETFVKNKIIMLSYMQAFKFCPVYFFYSDCSDSVKHKNTAGIFVDTNMVVNSNIVCMQQYYLVADQYCSIYNSSLGMVSEDNAPFVVEKGEHVREVSIAIKNRYFIQLHKPFPYFQIKTTDKNFERQISNDLNPALLKTENNLKNLYDQLIKLKVSGSETKSLKKMKGNVFLLNKHFEEFYIINSGYSIPAEIKQYIY